MRIFTTLLLLSASCLLFSPLLAEAPPEVSDAPERPERSELPSGPVTVPMDMITSQPVVEVKVNGKGPFRFLVDTGAAGCGRITSDLARHLELPEVGDVLVGDPSGKNAEIAKRVRVHSISIGEATFHGVQLLRRDDKERIDTKRRGINGILGFGLFRDVLFTMDYPGRTLVIEQSDLPAADGKTILSFQPARGIPQITLHVSNLEVDADLDSGSMGALGIPQETAAKLTFQAEPVVIGKASTGFNEFEIRMAPLDGQIRLGSYSIQDPSVEIFDLLPRANLGGRFLQRFRISFDQRNARVRFLSDRSQLAMAPRYRIGLMLRPDGDELVVEKVLVGPAKSAGVEPGDRIVRVNGQPPGDVELAAVFGSPKPVELVVLRAGQQRTFTIMPTATD